MQMRRPNPQCARLTSAWASIMSARRMRGTARYFVVYPPLIRMVWPVIHQPSLTR